jgi:hypothetical protein
MKTLASLEPRWSFQIKPTVKKKRALELICAGFDAAALGSPGVER